MSTDLPLVSVIVPVYNAENYLLRSVRSLLAQTYRQLEILYIDDGSTDNSLRRLEEEKETDPRIVVFSKENGGTASARNFGVRHAKGAYFAFVDADDYVSPFFVEALLTAALHAKAGISVCGFLRTEQPDTKFPAVLLGDIHAEIFSTRDYLMKMCEKNKTAATIFCNKLYARELFADFLFPEGMSYEDLAATHLLVSKSERIAVIEERLYAYFMTAHSVTRGKYTFFSFRSENFAWDERLRFFHDYKDAEIYGKALVSAQRNRVANFCKAYFTLREHRDDVLSLRRRFLSDLPEMKKIRGISLADRFLFFFFHYTPRILAGFIWPVYRFVKHPTDN